jgi:hypothetical protein
MFGTFLRFVPYRRIVTSRRCADEICLRYGISGETAHRIGGTEFVGGGSGDVSLWLERIRPGALAKATLEDI